MAELARAGARWRGRGRARRPGRGALPRRALAPGRRSARCTTRCSSRPCRAYRALAAAPRSSAAALRARARVPRAVRACARARAGSQTLNALIGAGAAIPLHGGDGWFPGRLVLVTENSYRQQLFNGDIGIAWPDETGRAARLVRRRRRAARLAAGGAAGARAGVRADRAQVAGFGIRRACCWPCPNSGARVLSRELLYTGLTRCRREVTLWAGEDALRHAIARRAQRWSGLAERL